MEITFEIILAMISMLDVLLGTINTRIHNKKVIIISSISALIVSILWIIGVVMKYITAIPYWINIIIAVWYLLIFILRIKEYPNKNKNRNK